MESFIGLVILIAAVASLIFFKKTISKIGDSVNENTTVYFLEGKPDLIKRANKVYHQIEELGDYKTADEIWDLINKSSKSCQKDKTNSNSKKKK